MLITRLWSQQQGKFFCVSTKNSRGDWRDNFFSKNELDEVDKFILDHHECDLYFCPTGFNTRRRLKDRAMLPPLLWADLDEADPRKFVEELKPTIAIESSPGRYVGLWAIDRPHDSAVNQALSYFLGADKGGWDITQVLRWPGTVNYKYSALPKTRILWSDGPSYRLRDVMKAIDFSGSNRGSSGGDDGGDGDAAAIYRTWERKIPHWARRALMGGERVAMGKRSEMMWKLGHALVECGVPTEDAFILLRASPWNKFEGRDNQLRRELEKILGQKLERMKNSGPGGGGKGGGGGVGGGKKKELIDRDDDYIWLARSMDEVEEENIDWIWYPYLARGELSILEGDPGLGKSYLAQMISGSICDGIQLPSLEHGSVEGGKGKVNGHANGITIGGSVTGKVVYFDIENSAGSVTLKRLRGNGFRQLHNYIQEEAVFSIDDDDKLDSICTALERVKPVLVVFDTLNTYLGKADAFKGHEAQQAFVKFREIAKRFQCAVMVLRHLTKSTKERALYRGQGSIAFAGLARVVMTVGVMPEDEDTRVMAVTKLNVAARPPAVTFTIERRPDTKTEKDRSGFVWGEFVELSSEDILMPISGNQKDNVKAMLKEWLKSGEMEATKLEHFAESHGVSRGPLGRAARELDVVRTQRGKTWWWSLSDENSESLKAGDAPKKASRKVKINSKK
jgi:hypothetical protein